MTHKAEERVNAVENDVEVVDDVQVLRLQLVGGLLRAMAIVGFFAAVAGTYDVITTQKSRIIPVYWWIAYTVILVLAVWRKSPYGLQIWVLGGLLFVLGVLGFVRQGLRGSAPVFLLTVSFVSGVFLGRRASFFVVLLNTLTMAGFGVAYSLGWLVIPGDSFMANGSRWISGTVVFFMLNIFIVGSLNYLVPRLVEALVRGQRLTQVLRTAQETLESQVAERTRDLERRAGYLQATSEVAREAATVLADPQQLLSRVVNLVSGRFGFYHAGIFLLDSSQEWAVLQAASSEGGQRMLARGHRLRVGVEGTVGYVVQHGEPRIALDVGEDLVFFNNPDLPETRSAITLPLRARGEIIGALDVQSTVPNAFSAEDTEVLQALADQVAVAISNARLFQQVQESADAERRVRGELVRAAWAEMLRVRPELGFIKEADAVVPVSRSWDQEMEMALYTGEAAVGGEAGNALAVPIKIGGQTVAVLDAHLPEGEGTWTSERVELLDALSAQIAQALDRARLYEATQRRAAREGAIREIADEMQRATDMNSLLRITTESLNRALHSSRVYVRMVPPVSSREA